MIPSPVSSADSARSVNEFGLQLYHELGARPGNLFFSPYSVAAAVSMVQAGAAGTTQAEIAKALHSPADPHGAMRELAASLKEADKDVKLNIANALWGQAGTQFGPDFLETAKRDYAGGFRTADFKKNAAKETDRINAWVTEQTKDRIKQLIGPDMLDASTRLVLTNAIYFKAAWRDQFDKHLTKPGPFHRDEGEVGARMMRQVERYGYYADDSLQALDLPYTGGRMSMLVLLPKKRGGLAALEKTLSAAALADVAGKLKEQKVDATLPRFKLEDEFGLNEALKALGMTSAFDAKKADFRPMCPSCYPDEPLYISAAVHKAFVAVDEEGTEAAAATAMVMATGSAMVKEAPPPVFVADHPFFFAVRDRKTGAVLFAGRLVSPPKE